MKKALIPIAIWIAAFASAACQTIPPKVPLPANGGASSPTGSTRLRIFLSDTHFGPGKIHGQWHPYEDFRWSEEFSLFLQEMKRQSAGEGDLIFNGDTLELWQALENDCVVPGHPNYGCTEDGAMHRIQRVLDAHRPELAAIGDFARDRNNQVIFVPGNHDAVLLFPRLAKALTDAVGAPAHVTVTLDGYWVSPDGLIYSEHGQQVTKEVNTFDHWPKPFVGDKNQYLQRTWGQQFVQEYYNNFELKYPIIDNVLGNFNGLKMGIKAEGGDGTVGDAGKFFSFYLAGLSFEQKFQPVMGGPGEPPLWNYKLIRSLGGTFLVDSIPANDEMRNIAQQANAGNDLSHALDNLTDQDIADICSYRQIRRQEDVRNHVTLPMSPCPSQLGALQSLLNSRNRIFAQHLNETIQLLRDQRHIRSYFQVFVWSHTHEFDPGFYPRATAKDGWNPLVINTGAWQRTITAPALARLQTDRHLSDKQTAQQTPEDLPACYSYVLVPPYSAKPGATLAFWGKTGSQWGQGASCGDAH